MSFKRLIPLALLAVVATSGTAFADNQWTGYVDHHNVPKSRADVRQDRSDQNESNQGDYLPRGWPRTY